MVTGMIHDEVLKLGLIHENRPFLGLLPSVLVLSLMCNSESEMESAVTLADSALYQAKSMGEIVLAMHPPSIH
ncbi:hypothetical protein OH492_23400 [Vibrio chagasii]|nr:hypothetical protein [Vibrio chagasii]